MNEETVVVAGGLGYGNDTILDSVEVLNLKYGHTWTQGWFTMSMVFF